MVLPKRTNQPTSISSKTAAQNAQEKQSAQLPKAVTTGSKPPNRTVANIKSSSGSKAPSIIRVDEPTDSTKIQVDSESDQPISISSQTAAQDAQGKQSAQGFSTKQPKAASDGSDPSNASDGSNPPTNTTEAQGKPFAESLSTDQKGAPLRRSEPSPPTKEKEEDSDSDLCIYPLSTEEKQFLIVIAEKHESRTTDFDLDLLMRVLNAIYQHSRSEMGFKDNGDQETDLELGAAAVDIGNDIRDIIQHLTMLIGGKYVQDMEVHEIAISIFDVLMNRTWEDKIVLISAAFIVSYSNFSSELLQRTNENPLVQSLSALDKRASPIKREELSSTFMPLSNLVKKLLEVCTLMIQFKEESSQHNIQDIKEKVMKVLHMVTYLTIKIVVTCSSYMESIITDAGYTTSDTSINQQNSFLKELTDSHMYVTELMSTIASHELQDSSSTGIQDIQQFLLKFFSEEKVLNGGQVSLKELNGNTTAFLISDLNVSIEKLTALTQTYNKILEEQKFKIVWIPMVDLSTKWTEVEEKRFSSIASCMQWYWCHPSMVPDSFSSHLTNEWQYQKKPRLVVLDEKANLISTNALPLVEAWGASAFPFSSDIEVSISGSWTTERMIKDLEIKMNLETEIVCIYGGYDTEMNKSFAENVEKINSVKRNQIMCVFVGTNKQEKGLQSITDSLQEKNVTCVSKDIMSTFWKRLSIILKIRLVNGKTEEEDAKETQLMTLLGYKGKDLWTMVMYKKSIELIKSSGQQLLECFNMFIETNSKFGTIDELWKLLIRYLKGENNDMVSEGITFTAYKKVRGYFGVEYDDVYQLLTNLFTQEKALNGGQVDLEKLKGKSVGFLITGSNVNENELTSIKQSYTEMNKGKDFEIIWIPMVAEERNFSEVTRSMSWYWCEPWMLTKDFSIYIRQEWYFQKKSVLVVLDNKAKLISVLPLVAKWGPSAFPWTLETESSKPKYVYYYYFLDDIKPVYNISSSQAGPSFSLRAIHGHLELVPTDIKDRYQQWVLVRSSELDEGGQLGVAIVNKGTRQAIQSCGKNTHVHLVTYDNSVTDRSILWITRKLLTVFSPIDLQNHWLTTYGEVVLSALGYR